MEMESKHIGSGEPATKGDLEQLREDLQKDMVDNFATKDDLRHMKDEILHHFDAAVEKIEDDLKGDVLARSSSGIDFRVFVWVFFWVVSLELGLASPSAGFALACVLHLPSEDVGESETKAGRPFCWRA